MIKAKQYFVIREATSPSEFIIAPNHDELPAEWTTNCSGSYGVAAARILGLSYPDYLRFLMQMFPKDVTIRGKGSLYPVDYWKKYKMMYTFVRLLNAKMGLAMGEYDKNEREV
jgi:hypothetical protein